MVEIMEETWKGMLVEKAASACRQLPSPAELRGKILVKVKHVEPRLAQNSSGPVIRRVRSSSSTSDSEDLDAKESGRPQKKSKIVESLGALGVYTRSYHFKSLTGSEAVLPTHVYSLSEKKLMEVHQSHALALFSHNRNFLMRAFPSGMRVSSSNLDPAPFWRIGVQMVALNWQKCDEGMMLNEGMFAGADGWVLKPKAYRGHGYGQGALSDEFQGETVGHLTLDLFVEILAAQDVPLPREYNRPDGFHPYVKVELHVEKPAERSGGRIEGDRQSKDGEYKMKTKASKGIEPDFRGEEINFVGIKGVFEELSFLR